MLGSLNILLEDFGVSRSGFLPATNPSRLRNSYYSRWEDIVACLPHLLRGKLLRDAVEEMPVLSTSNLFSLAEWQRAYLLLSFMTHGYIWGGETPSERLPPSLSVPFQDVSNHLGLPPTATYAALSLWNYTSSLGADLSVVDEISILHTFTGISDEEWFYKVSVAIEARGARIIPVMLEAMDAVRANESSVVTRCLLDLAICIQEIGVILERMHENCSPDIFYHLIRPFFAGSKNMGAAGLLRGIFYDEGDGKGEWRQLNGGSNAQSSLIQFFDIVLGVQHSATGNLKATPDGDSKHGFLQEMRNYMPGCHRRFLQKVESVANIREYVQKSASPAVLTAAYNLAVARLVSFRDIHLQIIARYIIGPSRKISPYKDSWKEKDIATLSSKACSKDGLPGTGGTALLPFLKQSRDETRVTNLF